MKKAILFRFYKEIDVCINRLKLIKKYNPELEIFGLYWWDKTQENEYKDKLWKYLNDFYTLESEDWHWKRIYWDLAKKVFWTILKTR